MTINPILKIIRAKKIGVLINDARTKSGKSMEECAEAMGITPEELTAIEYGERPPSLPEVEILAYYLEVPMQHFWGSEVLNPDGGEKPYDAGELKQLRQGVIGGLIRKARVEAEMSVEELGEKAGIAADVLESYEQGEAATPLPDLETLAKILDTPMDFYEDQTSPVGNWFTEQKNMREFIELPREIQEFIGKPINRPYLELAIRLSEIKVEKLRALAEGLLEITL